MSLEFISIKFNSPLRIGMPGNFDQATKTWIPSDTIFSWICQGWLQVFGEADLENSVINRFKDSQKDYPWKHSDFFMMVDNHLALPAPKRLNDDIKLNTSNETIDKKKRTNWVTSDSFYDFVFNKKDFTEKDYLIPSKQIELQNVKINKDVDNEPFQTGCIVPKTTCKESYPYEYRGFIELIDETYKNKLEEVFEYLTFEGIGGNRSSGLGQICDIEFVQLDDKTQKLLNNQGGENYFLLSPFFPTDDAIKQIKSNTTKSNYKLISRAGWYYDQTGTPTDSRKPKNHLFDTGSVFNFEPTGCLVDNSSEIYISYRYAIPFIVKY